MRKVLIVFLLTLMCVLPAPAETAIMGEPEVEPETLAAFVLKRNPSFNPSIAYAFIDVGRRYGIRGDIALCQAILETGWFRFADGTAVTASQHNYCGLGVTRRGLTGASFETIEQGVAAMMQHLYAYSCDSPLPAGERLVDPRFKLVKRGCATTWEKLSSRWAANPDYGRRILDIYSRLTSADKPLVEVIEVQVPEIHDVGSTADDAAVPDDDGAEAQPAPGGAPAVLF